MFFDYRLWNGVHVRFYEDEIEWKWSSVFGIKLAFVKADDGRRYDVHANLPQALVQRAMLGASVA